MDSHCPKKEFRENQKMVRSVVDVKNKPREIVVGVYRRLPLESGSFFGLEVYKNCHAV